MKNIRLKITDEQDKIVRQHMVDNNINNKNDAICDIIDRFEKARWE